MEDQTDVLDWAKGLRPRLEAIDDEIAGLEVRLRQLRELRTGIQQAIDAASPNFGGESGTDWKDALREHLANVNGRKPSAKELLVLMLKVAGRPLSWDEIQGALLELPHRPTVSAITSAFYHNTRAGDRIFVPCGAYAGLAGRDDEWQPAESMREPEEAAGARGS